MCSACREEKEVGRPRGSLTPIPAPTAPTPAPTVPTAVRTILCSDGSSGATSVSKPTRLLLDPLDPAPSVSSVFPLLSLPPSPSSPPPPFGATVKLATSHTPLKPTHPSADSRGSQCSPLFSWLWICTSALCTRTRKLIVHCTSWRPGDVRGATAFAAAVPETNVPAPVTSIAPLSADIAAVAPFSAVLAAAPIPAPASTTFLSYTI
mmetsp:Transcript_2982/g.6351  ORF Transcript_2982/g.6351 Transcript_2982/m.6351 type:complete len:207 (-) Transcript_2982:334-954(-)